MKNNKSSIGIAVTLSIVLTASISIPITFNYTKTHIKSNNNNNTNNNTNELNVTVDGNMYKVTADTITELATQNGKLSNQNEQLEIENKELKQKVNDLSEEKVALEEQLNEDVEVTETNENTTGTVSEKIPLNDLVLVDSEDFDIYEPFTDSYGNNYSMGYRLNASEGAYAVYSLKGEYKTLEFKIVAGEETGSDVEISLTVATDKNSNVKTIPKITKLTEVQSEPFGPYDISGARQLMFTTNKTGFNSYGHCYLVEAYVSK